VDAARRLAKHNQRSGELEAEVVAALKGTKVPAKRIAKEIGVSPQYLCDVKKGRRSISWDLAERLAQPK
jgi:plasmid maintenance system antidote protein VapI